MMIANRWLNWEDFVMPIVALIFFEGVIFGIYTFLNWLCGNPFADIIAIFLALTNLYAIINVLVLNVKKVINGKGHEYTHEYIKETK